MTDKSRIERIKKAMQIIAADCATEDFENGKNNPDKCNYCPMEYVCGVHLLEPCAWEVDWSD